MNFVYSETTYPAKSIDGSRGIVFLDPTVFSSGGVTRMAVTAGKNSEMNIFNVNNLSGYRSSTGQMNNVPQKTITAKRCDRRFYEDPKLSFVGVYS
jgi:hypothetical protein